jgi:hypothetical protein
MFMSVGLATVGSAVLVLWGLRRAAQLQDKPLKHRGTEEAEAKKASGARD